jgi:hypothetical protein
MRDPELYDRDSVRDSGVAALLAPATGPPRGNDVAQVVPNPLRERVLRLEIEM